MEQWFNIIQDACVQIHNTDFARVDYQIFTLLALDTYAQCWTYMPDKCPLHHPKTGSKDGYREVLGPEEYNYTAALIIDRPNAEGAAGARGLLS